MVEVQLTKVTEKIVDYPRTKMSKFLYILVWTFHLSLLATCYVAETSESVDCVCQFLQEHDFRGEIELPSSPGYSETIAIDNKRVVVYPDIVLVPFNEKDVSLSVLAARHCESAYAVRSGGHSAAGYCLSSGGITLDIGRGLNKVKNLPSIGETGMMYVESGALWASVYVTAQDTPYIPIGGGCPTVGTSGFLLGGGWSFLSRSHGLGGDNILSLRIVLANGTAVTASRTANRDLFWACQGAGGGNFGVVTSFIIQTHVPRSERMLIGELCWPPFDKTTVEGVWYWWLNFWPRMPSFLDVTPAWLLLDSADGMRRNKRSLDGRTFTSSSARQFCFTVICNGDPASECRPIIDPLIQAFPPQTNTLEEIEYIEWSLANVNVTDAQEGFLYLTSGVLLPGAMTVPLISQLVDVLQAAPSEKNLILFHIGGGKIAELSPTDTSFVHRDIELLIQIKGVGKVY